MNIYFGEIHTHTGLSDGHGEPADAIAVGKAHLDFCALADHAQWPDMPVFDEENRKHANNWREAVTDERERWPEVQQLVRDNYEPGKFVPFLGYEWTSQQWGDHNVYYLKDDEPIRYAASLEELYASLDAVDAMVIPHHPAYPVGHRGFDWKGFDSVKAPLVEIFSGHGSSETDVGPSPFLCNNMGPDCTAGTVRRGLDLGNVFGFIGSSDCHVAFPGSYGSGLAAVYAEELTRESLWDAFQNRRTYAITGDRIGLDFKLNGSAMGSILQSDAKKPRQIAVEVDGWDCLDKVEIIKNGKVVKRWNDFDFASIENAKRFKAGVQWGYDARSSEGKWDFSVIVQGGSIIGHQPCFRPPGFHQITSAEPQQLKISSNTINIQKAGLDIEGTPDTTVTIQNEGKNVLSGTIGELLDESKCVHPFGPYAGAFYLPRAVAEPHFHVNLEWEDMASGELRDYYYIRVFQKNGQMAWSSPIWTA